MAKLKERQFYNVQTGKNEMIPADFIEIVKFKNGAVALLGLSRKNVKLFKLFSPGKLSQMEKKYGKARKYKKSKK